MVRLRMSLLRIELFLIWALPILAAAYAPPPSATNSAANAIRTAGEGRCWNSRLISSPLESATGSAASYPMRSSARGRPAALLAEVALVRTQHAALEQVADPARVHAPAGVRALARARERVGGVSRGSAGPGGAHPFRAPRVDYRPRPGQGAHRLGDLPEHRGHGRLARPGGDRRPLHVRERMLRHGREPPLRRSRQARALAGLH